MRAPQGPRSGPRRPGTAPCIPHFSPATFPGCAVGGGLVGTTTISLVGGGDATSYATTQCNAGRAIAFGKLPRGSVRQIPFRGEAVESIRAQIHGGPGAAQGTAWSLHCVAGFPRPWKGSNGFGGQRGVSRAPGQTLPLARPPAHCARRALPSSFRLTCLCSPGTAKVFKLSSGGDENVMPRRLRGLRTDGRPVTHAELPAPPHTPARKERSLSEGQLRLLSMQSGYTYPGRPVGSCGASAGRRAGGGGGIHCGRCNAMCETSRVPFCRSLPPPPARPSGRNRQGGGGGERGKGKGPSRRPSGGI